MKIRQGFISNSSSSSFIVKDKELTTTARVALIMLCRVADDNPDISPAKLEEATNFLLKNLHFDIPLSFPWSINDKTYVWRRNDGIYVITSINHNFHEEMEVKNLTWSQQDIAYDEKYYKTFLDLSTMSNIKGRGL